MRVMVLVKATKNSEAGILPGDPRAPAGLDKLFEKMYDPEFPLRLLPPYVGSSDDEFRAFVRLLRERLPEWVPAPREHVS